MGLVLVLQCQGNRVFKCSRSRRVRSYELPL